MRKLSRPLALVVALAVAFILAMRVAVKSAVPQLVAGTVASAILILLAAASFRLLVVLGPCATDERGQRRDLLRRHGFWVIALGTCLALPTLGAFGLVDPWETHYAEVAREMIERRDFVSPWWANEGWFFSKPILTFWLEAASMVLFGVDTGPNGPIAGDAHPEWAVRFPAFAFALLGTYALYNGLSRTAGRRAGFLFAIVLWTCPGFVTLSHQAMTDMPLVGGVAASLGLFLRALATSDAKAVGAHTARIVAGAFLAAMIPQLALLVFSRSGAGSPHACGLPSQPACAALVHAHPRITALVQLSFWAPITGWIALRIAEERRTARLLSFAAWGCAAVATMAKGPAGLAVPLAGCVVAAVATRSPRALVRLAPHVGIAIVIALVVPWYVAAWARHGRVFVDELVMRHMLGRTLDHLHDTNAGEDVGIVYYVRQLAYATFPWSGLVAVAACAVPERGDDRSERTRVRALLYGAALFAFALVSSMRTKFHHYALVALPPLAAATAVFVDERLGEAASRQGRTRAAWTALLALLASAIVLVVARDVEAAPQRFVLLFTYRYTRAWTSTHAFAPTFLVAGVAAVIAGAAFALRRMRRHALAASSVVAVVLAAILVDVYLPRCAIDGGQRGIFEAYYRERPKGPIVAYQLNWKGESFYSGNDVAIFVSSGAPLRAYLDRRIREDRGTVYFVTERARVASLRAELGRVRAFTELTGADVSGEFTLVRAEL